MESGKKIQFNDEVVSKYRFVADITVNGMSVLCPGIIAILVHSSGLNVHPPRCSFFPLSPATLCSALRGNGDPDMTA
jgi:hypothetical protein